MKRIYEHRPNGSLAFADHLREGYAHLLSLDRKRRPKFRVIAANAFLKMKMGRKLGEAVFGGLVRAGVLRSLGFVRRRGVSGNAKEFEVMRRRIVPIKLGYTEYRSSPKRGPTQGRRFSTAIRARSGIGAYMPMPVKRKAAHPRRTKKQRKLLPPWLVKALLRHAGLNPNQIPRRVRVYFTF